MTEDSGVVPLRGHGYCLLQDTFQSQHSKLFFQYIAKHLLGRALSEKPQASLDLQEHPVEQGEIDKHCGDQWGSD